MTHLPFVAGSYGALGLLATWLSIGARFRLAAARARLAAVEGAAIERPAIATGAEGRRA